MNIYRHTFKAVCPNNGIIITYHLMIETLEKIMVESIIRACFTESRAYHEDLADKIYATIGAGRHTLRAFHHGVHIETRRGFD